MPAKVDTSGIEPDTSPNRAVVLRERDNQLHHVPMQIDYFTTLSHELLQPGIQTVFFWTSQAIGHSSKHPCPNLKNPIDPASTTAMTMIFFPCLRATNGLGRGGGLSVVKGTTVRPRARRMRSTRVRGAACDTAFAVMSDVFCSVAFAWSGCGILFRG
jgi:hypothetical protein